MITLRTHRLVAFALSLLLTLTIFSGVSSLSSPGHAGQWLVQTGSEAPRG
jgi:hypothetical protein